MSLFLPAIVFLGLLSDVPPNTTSPQANAPTTAQTFDAPSQTTAPPCARSENPGKNCRVRWGKVLLQAAGFNLVENVGNAYTGYWFRWETTHGKWFQRYTNSVTNFRYWRWSDDDPIMDDYVGHPIMGSITNYIFINNDPKGNYLEFENSRRYWNSRLRAFAFSAAYSAEWKVGPFGEAGVGFTGDHYYQDRGKWTNGTGLVDFIVTPIGGLLWTTTEDLLDKHLVKRLEKGTHGPVYLTLLSFVTPTHGFANVLALRAPWARDNRHVRSTWGVRDEETPEGAPRPVEVGTWAGGSWLPGNVIGSAHDYYGTFNVRYSRLLAENNNVALRYAGDLNGSVISEVNTNVAVPSRFNARRRVYGAGVSPFGLQLNARNGHTVQPFVDGHTGATYFLSKLSGPNGTTVNLTFDAGTGLQIIKKNHRSVTIGYRFQHFASTNFGGHVPGIDNNILFVGVSMFRSRDSASTK